MLVNGLYASDGEINLEKNDNLILNDYAFKLCLKYEVRKGKKINFWKIILAFCQCNRKLWEGTITIQPDFDPFLLSSDEEGKPNLDDLETLLDFDFDEVPQTETDLPPMICKIGKGSRNKKKVMENIMYFNNGVGPSSSIGIPLTQEEAEKRALAHNISMRYEILEEVRPFISKIARKSKVLTEETIRSLSTPVYCRDLDRSNLRELIDSKDRLIPKIPIDDVLRVAAQRASRVQRASMHDLYERLGSMEIRQEAIERMEYRHTYH
ncbi:hypothetical protein Tco_0812134 [Tanacetum coccineum]